jgi:hypothetical protein
MDSPGLRDPREVPLYVFSVLIIALIVVGVLLLGFLNALGGAPLRPGGRGDQGRLRHAAAPRARPPSRTGLRPPHRRAS